MKTQGEGSSVHAKRRALTRMGTACTLILDFSLPEL